MSFASQNNKFFQKENGDSFVISDSDDDTESPLKRNMTIPRDPKVIVDSDSESENSHNVDSNAESSQSNQTKDDSEPLDSEEEDLQFMNQSHKVSIVHDSDSESEEENVHQKKTLRRSIYENPATTESEEEEEEAKTVILNKSKRSIHQNQVDSPQSESTPINAHQRKRAKKAIIDSDSESEKENDPVNHQQKTTSTERDSSTKKVLAYDEEVSDDNSINEKAKSPGETSSDYQDLSGNGKSKQVDSSASNDHLELSESSISVEDYEHSKKNSLIREVPTPKHLMSDKSRSSNSSNFNGQTSKSYQQNRMLVDEQKNTNMVDLTMSDSTEDDLPKIDASDKKIDSISETRNGNQNLVKDGTSSTDEIMICSSSESEIDPDAAAFAKKEIGVGNINPIDAQKKEYLLISIDAAQKQLEKLNKFATSMDIQKLPDKGEKVLQTIKDHEQKINEMKVQLEKLNRKSKLKTPIQIQTPKTKSEPAKSTPKAKIQPTTSFKNRSIDNSYQISDSGSDYEEELEAVRPKQEVKAVKPKKVEPVKKFDDFDIHEIPNVPQASFDTADLGKKALETLQKQQSLTHKRIEQLHGSLTTRPTEDVREKDPYGLKIPLMAHQQHALAWMRWREKQKPRGGILADDMGLGKTLTMISLVLAGVNEKDSDDSDSSDDGWLSRKKHKRYYGGTLVVAPASLLKQWEAEVKNRCKKGLLTVLVYHGNNRNLEERKLSKFNIVVTTYQILVREAANESGLYKMEWNRIILDEAHYIRNHKSKACLAVCDMSAKTRWALTGTPIQNKEADLYAILKFLKCSPFDDLQVWKRWVENKSDAGRQRLVTIMKTIMLRRTKQELMSKGNLESLPDKFSELIEIEMDNDETLAYQKILLFSQNLFAQFLSQRAEKQHMRELYGGKYDRPFANHGAKTHFTKAQQVLLNHHQEVEAHEILVLLLRLRQMCCHPALIHAMLDKQDAEVNGLYEEEEANAELLNKLKNMSMNEDEEIEEHVKNYKIDERVAANLLTKKNPVFDDERRSSKVRSVMKTVEEILEKGDKVIIVSQWSSFLKIIARNLDDIEDANYAMFTGEVAVKNRQAIVDKLNDPRGETNVLLLSLTAGGVGLNLVGANHLLLIDIHWNPQLESQAQDRIYRFGQKKNVYVYKYICKDTIEERVKNLQDKKLDIANHVLTGTRSMSSKLTIEDLKLLFS